MKWKGRFLQCLKCVYSQSDRARNLFDGLPGFLGSRSEEDGVVQRYFGAVIVEGRTFRGPGRVADAAAVLPVPAAVALQPQPREVFWRLIQPRGPAEAPHLLSLSRLRRLSLRHSTTAVLGNSGTDSGNALFLLVKYCLYLETVGIAGNAKVGRQQVNLPALEAGEAL